MRTAPGSTPAASSILICEISIAYIMNILRNAASDLSVKMNLVGDWG
jgi:hypothetical protein